MELRLKKLEGLQFEEANHTYTLNGKLLPGVTTILDAKAKHFLKWWTVKLMYEVLLPRLQDVQGITHKEWDVILTEAKKAHTVKSKDALVSGKIAHEWIEEYIGAEIDGVGKYDMALEDEKAQKAVNAFLEWVEQHKIEWLASEIKLASVKYEFAGTIDAVARIDGKLTIVDFKTSNQMSEEYYLQTAAYQLLLDENLEDGEGRAEQRLILRIPKTGEECETKLVETPMDLDIKTFLALREVRRWDSYIESIKK